MNGATAATNNATTIAKNTSGLAQGSVNSAEQGTTQELNRQQSVGASANGSATAGAAVP